MKTTIAICSVGRASILHETVTRLFGQSMHPSEILIGAHTADDVDHITRSLPNVRVLISQIKGTSAQRNICIENVQTPYILFLDDDVELAENYLEVMERYFDDSLDVVLASAVILADGARTETGYTHEQGRHFIDQYQATDSVTALDEAIGCNFFVRSSAARAVRFDERLPLYGWLEDMDFSSRLRSFGSLRLTHRTALVHLGVPSGRTSGLRLGYSQIANPLYLWRKNAEPTFWTMLLRFWLRLTIANLFHSVFNKTNARMDRPGRLAGNFLAYRDLFRMRISPENILRIEDRRLSDQGSH